MWQNMPGNGVGRASHYTLNIKTGCDCFFERMGENKLMKIYNYYCICNHSFMILQQEQYLAIESAYGFLFKASLSLIFLFYFGNFGYIYKKSLEIMYEIVLIPCISFHIVMNYQNRSQTFKSHPKINSLPRSSQPAIHENNAFLKERPFLKNLKNQNSTDDGTIMSAKVRLQRPQEYLIKRAPQPKQYESEIEKLNQICQQFYMQNSKLKQQLIHQRHHNQSIWGRKVQSLQNQLKKNIQILSNKNRLIQDLSSKVPQAYQSMNQDTYTSAMRIRNYDSGGQTAHISRLMEELQKRENQLVKYMHKQSQFVQIYVEKEQLQQQVRKLQLALTSLTKQTEQLKRCQNKVPAITKQDLSTLKTEQNELTIDKIMCYNQKLLYMLQVSSSEIQRLNNILRMKVQEIESNRTVMDQQKQEIRSYKQSLEMHIKLKQNEQQIKKMAQKNYLEAWLPQSNVINQQMQQDDKTRYKKIKVEWQQKFQELSRENSSLFQRLADQLKVNQQLRELLENEQVKKNVKTEISNSIQVSTQTNEGSQWQNPCNNQKQDITKQLDLSKTLLHLDQQLVIKESEKRALQQKIQSLQSHIILLQQQNQQLSKFVVDQNKQIVAAKGQIRDLLQTNQILNKQIEKLEKRELQFPFIMQKMKILQEKLNYVTNQYVKILQEVQSSCSEAEIVQKQLQNMLEQQYWAINSMGGEKSVRLSRSQAQHPRGQGSIKINLKQNGHSRMLDTEQTSIRVEKKQMRSSQSQLFHKN